MLEDDDHIYAYDAKGNRISRTAKVGGGVETYSYDSQNRLVGYSSPTTTATYAYDALNRRIAKTVDGVVTAFVYDTWGTDVSTASDILMDFTDGTLNRRWLHSGRVDEPLSHEKYAGDATPGAGSVYEMYADRMGSITKVVDVATGAVVADYSYDAFGRQTRFASALFQYYGFTGRETDPESGLIYYRARTYDPAVGRFLQRDPIGFASGDTNLYAYVVNNPFNWRDSTGLSAFLECAGGRAGGGACGSMAGLINPIINAALNLTAQIGPAAMVLSVASDSSDTDTDNPPYIPATCNNGYFNQTSNLNPGSMRVPPTLFAQMAWLEIFFSPGIGSDIGLDRDPRFCRNSGWRKMQYTKKSVYSAETVTFHYQYNANLGVVADIKIVNYVAPSH